MKSSQKSPLPVQHPQRMKVIRAEEAPCRKDCTEKMNTPETLPLPPTLPPPPTLLPTPGFENQRIHVQGSWRPVGNCETLIIFQLFVFGHAARHVGS